MFPGRTVRYLADDCGALGLARVAPVRRHLLAARGHPRWSGDLRAPGELGGASGEATNRRRVAGDSASRSCVSDARVVGGRVSGSSPEEGLGETPLVTGRFS